MSGFSIETVAQRAYRDLNEAVATVDAARAIASYVLQKADVVVAERPHLLYHSLQIAFGAVVLVLRRFEEDWGHYLKHLFPADRVPGEAADLITEVTRRGLIDAASALVAHRSKVGGPPQSLSERIALVMRGGWATEDEVIDWYPSVARRLLAVRDALGAVYPSANQPEQPRKFPVPAEPLYTNDRFVPRPDLTDPQ